MFRLRIETSNAAFADGDASAELARILRDIADKLEAGSTRGRAIDYNGNAVGDWSL